ncbi:MAG: response regulator transcription factor [Phycisphaerae bacterium]
MANVLLVDDDVDLIEINSVVLRSHGHEVTAAYSAAEALKRMEESVPDVIVLDVMMETQTAGFEVARQIHEKHPDLPILLLTGVREATGVPFKFEPDETWLPVVEVLEKPFEPKALGKKVDELLKEGK